MVIFISLFTAPEVWDPFNRITFNMKVIIFNEYIEIIYKWFPNKLISIYSDYFVLGIASYTLYYTIVSEN